MIYGITMLTMMIIGITLPMVTVIPTICGGIATRNLRTPGLQEGGFVKPAKESQISGRGGGRRVSIESAGRGRPGSTGLK